MKKFVAILLCVAMLMVGVVAQAENGYVTMKALFGDKDQLGTGTSKTIDSLSDKKLVIIFDFRSEQIGLIGYNARGKCEGTVWNTDDFFGCCGVPAGSMRRMGHHRRGFGQGIFSLGSCSYRR